MSELPLALGDGGLSAAPDTGHVVGIQLAELGLTWRQSARPQTPRSQRRASENVQLMSVAAPDIRTVHAQVPVHQQTPFIVLSFYTLKPRSHMIRCRGERHRAFLSRCVAARDSRNSYNAH